VPAFEKSETRMPISLSSRPLHLGYVAHENPEDEPETHLLNAESPKRLAQLMSLRTFVFPHSGQLTFSSSLSKISCSKQCPQLSH